MSEPSAPSFQGMCHYIGQLSKASKAGMRAALADCPKCHFNMLEGLLHSINCHGKDGAIYVSDLAREIRQPLPAVSRGLRLMEQDGTVVREQEGSPCHAKLTLCLSLLERSLEKAVELGGEWLYETRLTGAKRWCASPPKGTSCATSVSRLCATTLPACWHG